MTSIVKRGYTPKDCEEFSEKAVETLLNAGQDLLYLLERGYHIKGASAFVGNHYMLSERQRLAVVRAVSQSGHMEARRGKQLESLPQGSIVNIDGFNTIITLEVAASDSLLLKCMDGTIRDLAALRGTYRLIDKTDTAILWIGKALERHGIGKAVFYLDAPVSNSGRLKQRIMELLEEFPFEVQVEVINGVDSALEKLENVITSDAIILDKCVSWVNLNAEILEDVREDYPYIDFGVLNR